MSEEESKIEPVVIDAVQYHKKKKPQQYVLA